MNDKTATKTRKPKRPDAQVTAEKLLNLETMEQTAQELKKRSPAAARMLADLLKDGGAA